MDGCYGYVITWLEAMCVGGAYSLTSQYKRVKSKCTD